ncbi:GDP-L-fucose synthase family protein [Parapedobacter tibetensis]|uniref:GDP-L-fucose synthase family protein n=1 Tax=Parapedobacter tibetensis TaxID=2972951 RepID=UPI00214D1B93|nr:GDP-L-fucose synthase [Parapedobacter tibetensis]
MNKDAKIYIAGHRGLVGSAILKNLQDKDYTNLITRMHAELDLTDTRSVADFFAQEKPEYVFLAAAKVGGIVANNTYRGEFIYENLMIQNNVIHQSYVHGVKKLLFLGSTCIYPKEAPQPIPENALLTGPLEYTNEPYAIAKIAGIKLCESYNIQYGTNFISVMPTNLYGPNDNFDLEKSHVLPALIRKIHLGKALENSDWNTIREDLDKRPIEGTSGRDTEERILSTLNKYGIRFKDGSSREVQIEIWGSGKPMREFLWSKDMADACIFIMENRDFKDFVPQETDEIRNTHLNIGTGEDISIAELVSLIKIIIDFRGNFVYDTAKPDGTLRKLTDPSKLQNLGWIYKTSLKEGIKKIYKSYK